MTTIHLRQFGSVLVSRPAGLEAFNAIRPTLDPQERVKIDFDGVLTVTSSWFDEFLTQLADYTGGDVDLLPTENTSVQALLPVLATAREDLVADIIRRALAQPNQTS